jgi:hypothetical protein
MFKLPWWSFLIEDWSTWKKLAKEKEVVGAIYQDIH